MPLYKFAPASELGPAEDYPAGSIEWAERISNRLQIGAGSINQHTVHHLLDTIKAIFDVKPHPWEVWPKDHPFGTPDDYCHAVTGHNWEFLVALVREFSGDAELRVEQLRTDLAKAQAEHRGQGTRTDLLPAIGRKSGEQGSNNRERILRRLARERPDILRRYEDGEFKSARSAAVEAGFIKVPSPFESVQKLLAKMSVTDRRRLFRQLEKEFSETPPEKQITTTQLSMFRAVSS
jgi:hypothetical protein